MAKMELDFDGMQKLFTNAKPVASKTVAVEKPKDEKPKEVTLLDGKKSQNMCKFNLIYF